MLLVLLNLYRLLFSYRFQVLLDYALFSLFRLLLLIYLVWTGLGLCGLGGFRVGAGRIYGGAGYEDL